jgi:hypothetical protein
VRLLILGPNQRRNFNWGHQLFRDEFQRHSDAVYYGYGFEHKGEPSVQKIIDELGPFDAVTIGDQKYCGMYNSMADLKIPTLLFLVDYLDRNAASYEPFIRKHHPDVVFLRSSYCPLWFLIPDFLRICLQAISPSSRITFGFTA